jgi:hypothetical protein
MLRTDNENRREAVLPLASERLSRRFDASLGRSNGTNETELSEGGYTIIQADLFDDLAVFEAKHGRSREMHFATSCGRQRTSQKVVNAGPVCIPPPSQRPTIALLSDSFDMLFSFGAKSKSRG